MIIQTAKVDKTLLDKWALVPKRQNSAGQAGASPKKAKTHLGAPQV